MVGVTTFIPEDAAMVVVIFCVAAAAAANAAMPLICPPLVVVCMELNKTVSLIKAQRTISNKNLT